MVMVIVMESYQHLQCSDKDFVTAPSGRKLSTHQIRIKSLALDFPLFLFN